MVLVKEMVKEGTGFGMNWIVGKIRNGYGLCVPGDLNDFIGERVRAGITGAFGVPRDNGNGKKSGRIMC